MYRATLGAARCPASAGAQPVPPHGVSVPQPRRPSTTTQHNDGAGLSPIAKPGDPTTGGLPGGEMSAEHILHFDKVAGPTWGPVGTGQALA
jgi:hypothetical protein